MTSVGTPIYVAPEVMAGNRYDATADSYSFGICLVAMIRAEKEVMEFYFQALRKTMKRKTKKGVGITTLNNMMYSKGWRPLLPLEFERSYPKVCKILKQCWAQQPEDRPSFDEIVKVMQGEVTDEVRREEEPIITIYKDESDSIYQDRLGKNKLFEEEEEGASGDTTIMISKKKHEQMLKELSAKLLEKEVESAENMVSKSIYTESLLQKDAALENKDVTIAEKEALLEKKTELMVEMMAKFREMKTERNELRKKVADIENN